MQNPDYTIINLYNLLPPEKAAHGHHVSGDAVTPPVSPEGTAERAEKPSKNQDTVFNTGSGAYAYTYKLHLLVSQHFFRTSMRPKKLNGPCPP